MTNGTDRLPCVWREVATEVLFIRESLVCSEPLPPLSSGQSSDSVLCAFVFGAYWLITCRSYTVRTFLLTPLMLPLLEPLVPHVR